MNNLQVFKYLDLGEIRAIMINNEPWFVAVDVCKILGLTNPSMSINKLDTDERTKLNLGRQGNTNIVNEYGLYNLILGSRKPEAKQFKRWITHEVIPAIRKTGGYIKGEENMSDDELVLKAFNVLNKKLEIAHKQLEEQKQDVYFSNVVGNSNHLILIRDLAKLISQTGYDIGEKRLYKWLRENGYLVSGYSMDYNSPTQKSINLGLFQLKEKLSYDYYGREIITKTTYVTGKGQQYFINKFSKMLKTSSNTQKKLCECPF